MITIYYRTIKDKKIRRLKRIKRWTWVNVVDPTEREIKYLRELGVGVSFIEDALDPDELPRIEIENGTIYVMLNVPQEDRGKVLNIPLLVVITKDIFITLSKKHLDCLKLVLSRRDIYTTQKTKNLLQICLQTTELYTKETRIINKKIFAKKVTLSKLKNKDIVALIGLEEALSEFITSLVSLIGIFEKILSGKYVKVFEADQELLEDLIIDSQQSLDMCKTSIKKIVNIREAYSTILTNNLNRVMKILAFLTLVMGIPNIIAGFYGMNVRLPIQGNPLAFFYIFILALVFSLILVLIFYLKKWF